MKKLLLTFALVAAFSTSACQTFKGFGKDIENLGDNIQGKE